MKKRTALLIVAAVAVLALAITAYADAATMSVQVRDGVLRESPTFLGRVVAQVAYGERLDVIESQGAWSQVRAQGKVGWIQSSALTSKTIQLQAGEEPVGTVASSDELALAGKGFNSQVEAEFKSENRDVDYAEVDKMEKIKISESEMKEFLRIGGLKLQ